HPRGVHGWLRDEVEGVLVVLRGLRAVPALEQAHHKVAVIRPEEVPRVRIALLGRTGADVVVEVLLTRSGDAEVTRQDLPTDRVVGVALDVGVTALGVHPTARTAHVAEDELEQRPRANELAAGGVMGES